ncbi:hypothetical protein [Usitatibacter palustris]|uniref:Uncharacterized protein n=1 Tax=Usitatibacter palustris TaxID=2732487 RepID=A0A6M4H6V0_9PROT|nr:hypothetical protein [Usitatibacter palustris]QJR14393.1 hypothetical protein DSM104440_01189 [Usitatibacter palustris]
MNAFTRYAAFALVALGLVACKKDPPPAPPPPTSSAPAPEITAAPPAASTVAVANATLGSAVGSDKKISAATESFAKGDTFHVSVDTTGAGTANLKTKWTYFEKDKSATTIAEQSQTIAPAGPATTEFNVNKPDGWPVGDYQVEVSINDQVAQTKKFAVK